MKRNEGSIKERTLLISFSISRARMSSGPRTAYSMTRRLVKTLSSVRTRLFSLDIARSTTNGVCSADSRAGLDIAALATPPVRSSILFARSHRLPVKRPPRDDIFKGSLRSLFSPHATSTVAPQRRPGQHHTPTVLSVKLSKGVRTLRDCATSRAVISQNCSNIGFESAKINSLSELIL